jgi:hypothetical protein
MELSDQELVATEKAPVNINVPTSAKTVQSAPKIDKKKRKNDTAVKVETAPHLEGRVTKLEMRADEAGKMQILFSLKAKKGKPHVIEIAVYDKEHNSTFSAVLAAAISTKNKVHVEYALTLEGRKLARCIELHSKA